MSDLVPSQCTMRVLGVVIVILSVIEIAVAAVANNLTNWKGGAWWAGAICMVTSIFAIVSNNRCAVIAGCIFSVISILVLIGGLIVDGIIFGLTKRLDTCLQNNSDGTQQFYGDESYDYLARLCYIDNSQESESCFCVTGEDTDECYLIDLESAKNCGQVLTKLPSLLLVAIIFMVLLFTTMLTYSIFTCKSACCASPEDARLNNNAVASNSSTLAEPIVVIATPVSADGTLKYESY